MTFAAVKAFERIGSGGRTGRRVRRRPLLVLLAAAAAVWGVSVGSAPALSATPQVVADEPGRPNVILVKTDDQVWDTPERLRQYMPHVVDFFESNGVSYDNSSVSSPSCCQSRASTFVGRYPHNTGVKGQGLAHVLDTRGSIASYLQGAGYRTALFGKYLNLMPLPEHFDESTTVVGSCTEHIGTEFCGTSDGRPAWYYNFVATYQDGSNEKIRGNATTGENYNTTWIGDRAADFLGRALQNRTETGQPFYLEFNPTAPHLHDVNIGYTMPEPQYRTADVPGCPAPPVEADRTDKPSFVQAFPQSDSRYGWRTICPVSQKTLKSVDDWFGRTIATLSEAGQLENTLVVFTSDNGLMNGEHGMLRKYVAYAPSVKVPLMIAYPGVFAPQTPAAAVAGSALVSNIDIAPTILSVTGISQDPTLPAMDGRSLVTSPSGHSVILSEYFRDGRYSPSKPAPIPTWASTFDGRYKFIVTYDRGRPLTQELYDQWDDPDELTNLLPLTPMENSRDHDAAAWHAVLNKQRSCKGTVRANYCR